MNWFNDPTNMIVINAEAGDPWAKCMVLAARCDATQHTLDGLQSAWLEAGNSATHPAYLQADVLIDSTPELPYFVGVTATCERLARFRTADHAAAFIGTLPDHAAGIYYLDGPER